MQVTITYTDSSSLVAAEAIKRAKDLHGKSAEVQVSPESDLPEDMLYFAIQQLITHEQLSMLYNSKAYHHDLKFLRARILAKLTEVLDTVIVDNESKVG